MCLFDYDKHIGKLAMLTSIFLVLCLLHCHLNHYHHVEASRMSNIEQDKRELGIRFKQAITDVMKKFDDLSITCPLGSFFYNGSCYFYLPPKQIDNLKGIGFIDVSVDEVNNRGVQSIIGIIFICLAILIFLFHSSFHFLCRLRDKDKNLINNKNFMSTINSHRHSCEKFYSIPNISSDQLILKDGLKNPAFSNDNESSTMVINSPHTIVHLRRYSTNSSSKSSSSSIFCHHSFLYYFWRLFICLITIIFATFCCHTIYQFKIQHLNTYEKFHNITKEKTLKICQLFQTNLNLYYKIPANYISLCILFILILIQILFENFSCRKKRTFKSFWQHISIPMIFNSHSHIYRFQSAAVFGIIALEILHIFDEYIINGAKHFQHGPLIDLIIQFGIGLMLGLRYFPILSIFEKENNYENRLENLISYGLGTIYLYCEIIFKLQSDINCTFDKRKISIIKDTLEKLQQMGINIKQYMITNLGTNRTGKFNETYMNTHYWYNNKIQKYPENLTYDDKYEIENELINLNYSLELNKQSILYNILRNAPYYYFIVYLAVCLTILFLNTFRGKLKKSSSLQTLPRWKYVKYNLLKSSKFIHSYQQYEYSRLFRCLNFLINFFKKYIYSIRLHFRYSKLIICIYTSAFTLVYYFTFWIQDHTYILTKKLLLFLNLILCGLADLSKDLCYNLNLYHINQDIKYICLLTAFITCLQLFFGLKHYQIQMCNAYKGIFIDIPKPKTLSSVSIISRSIHYPGRFMGSLVYSYGFLFLFISIFYILSRYIFYSLIILEFISKLLLPMIIFFLFQLLFVRLLCKLLFIQNNHLLALRNLRLYYTFSYFSFFFDCFLGFIMCLSRISKGFFCTLIFFARLDYSAYGRGLEMYDSSYASYVSFFHIERNQRHPVLNVFIDIIRQRLIDIRKLKLKLTMENINQTYENEKFSQLRRFRWALAYTLIHNEQLKRYRKHRLCSTKTNQSKTLERIFDKIGLSQTLPRKY
ncbi:unnamed protein product [Rotaria sordida]|uniref:Uncharacterized protein n=2 Tax=Rotaria sordida TaxID=392033 RepID=A0A814R4C4_9BILA|nr:unnamed protein product [Rotaria sordida]